MNNPGAKKVRLQDKWENANSVIVMDLDRDDRLDIAATAERTVNEFRWWKNLGPAGPEDANP